MAPAAVAGLEHVEHGDGDVIEEGKKEGDEVVEEVATPPKIPITRTVASDSDKESGISSPIFYWTTIFTLFFIILNLRLFTEFWLLTNETNLQIVFSAVVSSFASFRCRRYLRAIPTI